MSYSDEFDPYEDVPAAGTGGKSRGGGFESPPDSRPPFPSPAGFWIRFGAQIVDGIVFLPLTLISLYAYFNKILPLMVLTWLPGFFYKPVMESMFGATLGKMACGLRVIDQYGRRLSLGSAYVRFIPFLAVMFISSFYSYSQFSKPQPPVAQTPDQAMAQLSEQFSDPLYLITMVLTLFLYVECLTAAFAQRKRAIHDKLAGSYCVWKDTMIAEPKPASGDDEFAR